MSRGQQLANGDADDAVRGDTGDDVLIGADDDVEKDRLKAGDDFDVPCGVAP